ncbi:MAG: hypothetical protein R8K46_08360, partial [Mariprofundaceae bacterium]
MTGDEQRRFEVILEDIQSKLGIVLEGHDALRAEFNRKVDNLQQGQNLFMSLLKGVHDDLDTKIDGVENKLSREMQSMGAKLDEKIDGVENKLRHEMQSMGVKLDAKIDGVEDKLSREMQSMGVKLDEKIDGVAKNINKTREELAGEIRAVGDKVDGHEA